MIPKQRPIRRARRQRRLADLWWRAFLPCLAAGLPAAAQQAVTTQPPEEALPQDSAPTPVPLPSPYVSQPYTSAGSQRLPPLPPTLNLGTEALPSPGQIESPRMGVLASAPAAAAAPRRELLQWGTVSFHPHLSYNLLYGTGILSGPDQEENTLQQTVSPGLTFQLGPQWTLDYTASLKFYSNEAYEDTVDHHVNLSGWATWNRWRFTAGYAYGSTSSPLIETAAQTEQDTHNARLGADYAFSDRTTLELSAAQVLRFTTAYTDSCTWSTTDWINYQWQPRLAVAVGAGFAYDQLDPGTDMTSQRILGRVRGEVGRKLSYTLEGGVEIRQFLDTDASSKLSPTVQGAIDYELAENTTVSLFGSHDIGTSYYSDQFTETSSVGASVRQRLLRHLSLGVSGGYSFTSYSSTFATDTVEREDDRAYVQVSLSTLLRKRIQVSAFYRYSDNSSDSAGYSSGGNQVGLMLSYAL